MPLRLPRGSGALTEPSRSYLDSGRTSLGRARKEPCPFSSFAMVLLKPKSSEVATVQGRVSATRSITGPRKLKHRRRQNVATAKLIPRYLWAGANRPSPAASAPRRWRSLVATVGLQLRSSEEGLLSPQVVRTIIDKPSYSGSVRASLTPKGGFRPAFGSQN